MFSYDGYAEFVNLILMHITLSVFMEKQELIFQCYHY